MLVTHAVVFLMDGCVALDPTQSAVVPKDSAAHTALPVTVVFV